MADGPLPRSLIDSSAHAIFAGGVPDSENAHYWFTCRCGVRFWSLSDITAMMEAYGAHRANAALLEGRA